jgi:hypothetical protein
MIGNGQVFTGMLPWECMKQHGVEKILLVNLENEG